MAARIPRNLSAATQAPARNAKRKKILHPEDMPWEMARQGLLKHLLNEGMNTRMETVDAYMQIIPPGSRSGKHRHMWEELAFVVEGEGYDLHWDMKFDCLDAFQWEWAPEPKAYSWKRGDYIYIPPFTNHRHVAGDQAVAADRVGGRVSGEVGDEAHEHRPADPAGRVPAEEPPPAHARDPRHPGGGHAKDGEEPTDEDRLGTVPVEEPLRPGQHGLRPAADEPPALQEPASAGPPDPVAEVVADDRRGCRDGDDRDDVQLSAGGVDPARDQCRLPGKRDPAGLEHHDQEERDQPVVVDEAAHLGSVGGTP